MAFAQDYVDVAERIREWYDRYPEGRIITEIVEFTETRATVKASAFRPGESVPAGVGHSYLALPGTTNFTRGSELENAETSAAGRALVMAGIPAKNVASFDELASKSSGTRPPGDRSAGESTAPTTSTSVRATATGVASPASPPASKHLAGVEGAGSQSAGAYGEGVSADEEPASGAQEGNPDAGPSNDHLTKEEQKVFADAFGGQAKAVKAARERYGDRIRGLSDLDRAMATELVAWRVADKANA